MAMAYVRADEVLPPELLVRVRKHYTGMVYVPAAGEFYEGRRREVLSLHRKGYPTSVIAERVHVCRRRVQQIIRDGSSRR
jgi:DNA-binding NarL/FixJ family response regulator